MEEREFEMVTDHASVKWLMRQSDLSDHLARCSKISSSPSSVARGHSCTDALEMSTLSDEDTTILDLNSPTFKSAEYLLLIVRIQDNSNQLPDLRVVDGYVYKRTEHASGDALQEASSSEI